MQTRNLFYTASLIITMGTSSCSKNIIELTPDSELTTAQYFKTAKDLDLAVLGIYSTTKQEDKQIIFC